MPTILCLIKTIILTTISTATKTVTKLKENQKLFIRPVRHVAKKHFTEGCYCGANAANRPHPRHKRPEGQNQVQQKRQSKSFE